MPNDIIDLWSYNNRKRPEYDELEVICNILLNTLQRDIADNLECVKQHYTKYDSVVCTIRWTQGRGIVSTYYEGKVMYTVSDNGPYIDVIIFPHIFHNRVCVYADHNNCILQLTGTRNGDSDIKWVNTGWHNDEFSEWDYIKSPEWLSIHEPGKTYD
jgi:hypothetical protein